MLGHIIVVYDIEVWARRACGYAGLVSGKRRGVWASAACGYAGPVCRVTAHVIRRDCSTSDHSAWSVRPGSGLTSGSAGLFVLVLSRGFAALQLENPHCYVSKVAGMG